jgi:hypothetical protein
MNMSILTALMLILQDEARPWVDVDLSMYPKAEGELREAVVVIGDDNQKALADLKCRTVESTTVFDGHWQGVEVEVRGKVIKRKIPKWSHRPPMPKFPDDYEEIQILRAEKLRPTDKGMPVLMDKLIDKVANLSMSDGLVEWFSCDVYGRVFGSYWKRALDQALQGGGGGDGEFRKRLKAAIWVLENIRNIWDGTVSKIDKPETILIKDDKAWSELWKRHTGRDAAPPKVDFETMMIHASFFQKSSVVRRMEAVGETKENVVIQYRASPKRAHSFLIVALKRTDKPIVTREVLVEPDVEKSARE